MKRLLLVVLWLTAFAPAVAHEYSAGDIVIEHPWARPSFSANANGVAYMTIVNNGVRADRLLNVSGGIANRVELHATKMDGDVMRMRPVSGGVEIAPGEKVEIGPGGLHVMLMGLAVPLKEGDKFPITLEFEHAGAVEVSVHVENKAAPSRPEREHHH
jgi:copper(I)-binding protein